MMLIVAGLIGTTAGVWLFTLLRRLGQLDLTIAVSYLLLLGIVGRMMVVESVRAILRARGGRPAEIRRPGSHLWIHGLPLKMRFKVSKIYVSVIPIWVIGFVIGFIGAIMGIGGGFMLVPALIYLIRVPTGVVIGTSMVLTLVTMAYATVIHAATNHLVDALLALMLMIGGVIGAQFGARTGQRFSGEQLAPAARRPGALGRPALRLRPRGAAGRPVHDALDGGAAMSARRLIALATSPPGRAARRPRAAERLVIDAVDLARADRFELHRRRRGAVRLGRARRADGRAARRLRHRRDGDAARARPSSPSARSASPASGSMRTRAPSSRRRPISPCCRTARSTTSPTSTRCGARRPGSRAPCCRRRSPATSRTRSATIRSARRSCG